MKATQTPPPECPDCAALRKQLLQARKSHDALLLELAQARELNDALRLALPQHSAEALPNYPSSAGPGAPPFRYLLADSANDALKRYLGPVQEGVKQVAKLLTGEKKEP